MIFQRACSAGEMPRAAKAEGWRALSTGAAAEADEAAAAALLLAAAADADFDMAV